MSDSDYIDDIVMVQRRHKLNCIIVTTIESMVCIEIYTLVNTQSNLTMFQHYAYIEISS